MKRLVVAAMAAAVLVHCAHAQNTNPPPTLSGAVKMAGQAIENSTNWAAVVGAGHSVEGPSRFIAHADLAYNLTPGEAAGVNLVLGYDATFTGHKHEYNFVSGGLSLDVDTRPLAFLGQTFLTNVACTVYGGTLMANPYGGGNIGVIIIYGANFDVIKLGGGPLELCAGIEGENRSGQGYWDGNYAMAYLGIHKNPGGVTNIALRTREDHFETAMLRDGDSLEDGVAWGMDKLHLAHDLREP